MWCRKKSQSAEPRRIHEAKIHLQDTMFESIRETFAVEGVEKFAKLSVTHACTANRKANAYLTAVEQLRTGSAM